MVQTHRIKRWRLSVTSNVEWPVVWAKALKSGESSTVCGCMDGVLRTNNCPERSSKSL